MQANAVTSEDGEGARIGGDVVSYVKYAIAAVYDDEEKNSSRLLQAFRRVPHNICMFFDHPLSMFLEPPFFFYHSVCPLVGIGTHPTPLLPASVPLPPEPGGWNTRVRVRSLESPNSDDFRKSLAL